ncbi:hypothetical protein [Massilia niabensis]|uniref:Lysozyme inhibitor LprI N-terminal domain-containing protein n=1 Tax=Massilia niabensis TaxID=544910 RepID=A0ABW0L091_9BURK
MNARHGLKRILAGCLLAGAAACAGAQTGSNSAGSDRTGSDATVSAPAADKQAREIARGDPVRWYREDATEAQRMRTRQKEIGAALNEAKNACRQGPAAERRACLKAAQDTWQKEMAQVRQEAPVQSGS